MLRKVPLIVILGSTGTGKTKLSIELAQKFNGEIISADSMQMYKGLDIVTAKATEEEQLKVPHHLLNIATPNNKLNVVDFRDLAIPIIDKCLINSKIPIIVGGTNYYIESLLWKVLIPEPKQDTIANLSVTSSTSQQEKLEISELPKENKDLLKILTVDMLDLIPIPCLHELLQEVDPNSAQRLHPNNRRKVINALEVYLRHGEQLSLLLEEQRKLPGGSYLGGPLRYEHVILFWLQCNQDILNNRLDLRVDAMLSQGLLKEIRSFYNTNVRDREHDCTKGVLQTIGFKECLPYLENYHEQHDADIMDYINKVEKPNQLPDGLEILLKCLEELKMVTRRYSKKQIKWVKFRFLNSSDRIIPNIYGLDTTYPNNWFEEVYSKAEHIVDCYLKDKVANISPIEKQPNPRAELNENVTNYCEVCERVFIGEYQWQIHMKSKKHKLTDLRKKKNQQQEA